MGININSKILLSVASIAAAAALIVGATVAFFSDTETSTGNTFAAGELDLFVDSECHYYRVDTNPSPSPSPRLPGYVDVGCGNNGTWTESDLVPEVHKFFNFNDVKPGDRGEDTISLHVVDNDAWAWFSVTEEGDSDVTCTEPETESTDPQCVNASPGPSLTDGELQEALDFNVWLDQGVKPGFQGKSNDVGEGDNIFNQGDIQLATPGPIDDPSEQYNLWQILAGVRAGLNTACDGADDDPDGDGVTAGAVGLCQGLPDDGHLVGSTTYYFGVGWELPSDTGNEVQSDSFVADMEFKVEQYRNNPSPSPFPI